MRLHVLFFGAAADAAESRELNIEDFSGDSAGSLLEFLRSRNPRLAGRDLLVAINEEHAGADSVLNDGDEVAIFTAVSGG